MCALAEGSSSRQLATMDFLREVAKIGGIRHEVSAIYKRWILGSGCPQDHCGLLLQQVSSSSALFHVSKAQASLQNGLNSGNTGSDTLQGP